MASLQCNLEGKKEAPEIRGQFGRNAEEVYGPRPATPENQRPNRGRSPLRIEILALAISARSIDARRRPNRDELAVTPSEAVLDIGIPFQMAPRAVF